MGEVRGRNDDMRSYIEFNLLSLLLMTGGNLSVFCDCRKYLTTNVEWSLNDGIVVANFTFANTVSVIFGRLSLVIGI